MSTYEFARPTAQRAQGGTLTHFQLWSLASFQLFSTLAASALNTILPSASKQLAPGHSAETLGTAMSFSAVADVAGFLVLAASDRANPTITRLGRRVPFVATGVLVGLSGVLAFAAARSRATLVAGYALALVGYSVSSSVSNTVISESIPSSQSGTASAFVSVNGAIGGIFALLAISTGAPTWLLVGLIFAVSLSGLAILSTQAARRKSPTRPATGPQQVVTSVSAGRLRRHCFLWDRIIAEYGFDVSKHRDFVFCLGMRFSSGLAMSCMPFLQLLLADCVGIGDANVTRASSVLFLLAIVASLIVTVPVGIAGDRWGKKVPMLCGIAATSLSFAIMPALRTTLAAAVTAFLFGVGVGTYSSLEASYVYDSIPTRMDAGKFLGLSTVCSTGGSLLGQLLTGYVLQSFKVPGRASDSFTRTGYAVIFLGSSSALMVNLVLCSLVDLGRAIRARKSAEAVLPICFSPPPVDLAPVESTIAPKSAMSPAAIPRGAPPAVGPSSASSSSSAPASPRPPAIIITRRPPTPPPASRNHHHHQPPQQQQQQQQQQQPEITSVRIPIIATPPGSRENTPPHSPTMSQRHPRR